jgi:hypothetical protein
MMVDFNISEDKTRLFEYISYDGRTLSKNVKLRTKFYSIDDMNEGVEMLCEIINYTNTGAMILKDTKGIFYQLNQKLAEDTVLTYKEIIDTIKEACNQTVDLCAEKPNIMKKYINKLISKYIGNIEYIVTVVGFEGGVSQNKCKTIKEIDDLVNEINSSTYHQVQKIEKFRKYSYKYNKNVLHTPLWFQVDDVTEMHNCDDYDFSFLKINDSLTNVTREKHRKYTEESDEKITSRKNDIPEEMKVKEAKKEIINDEEL